MQRRWILKEADEGLATALSEALKMPKVLARVLMQRDLSQPEAARAFFSSSLSTDLPSPFLMAGMKEAVERLVLALQRKERVCVWGDYDVDGTTGAAVLVTFLREIGGDPQYYVPHRIHEGYGLNSEGLRRLKSLGAQLIVSVDCGISNHAEVEVARELGIDTVIVDHHELPLKMPSAAAIINPHRSDCAFPDKSLSAAGLAFYLVIGLRAKLREIGWFAESKVPDIRRYLDIIALGTIADMVPLKGVNRVLTRRGLVELASTIRPGLLALKQVAGISEGKIQAGQVGFRLGPRINAAGRMDVGLKVVEMLTTDSQDTALRIARELDEHNRERQQMEGRVLKEALSQISADPSFESRYTVVLASQGWHPGVLGIVASRVVDRFHRPTVVIGFDQERGKGSARSIRGFHLVEGLKQCADFLEGFGGHEFAGGLTIKPERWRLFSNRFEEVARSVLTPEHLVPVLEVDSALSFSEIGLPLARMLREFEPFGVGNPEPLFMSRDVEVLERREFNGGCRLRLRQTGKVLEAVAFGESFKISGNDSGKPNISRQTPGLAALPGARIDIVFRLSENEWNGSSAVELRIADLRASG